MNVNRARAWIRPVVALLAGLLFFLPIYLVLVNVFKDGSAIVSNPVGLPVPPTLDNIQSVLSRPDHLFWYGLVNSTEVTVISILVITAISAMLGHYLARSTGVLAKVIMVVLLCGLMVPPAVILTPITEVLRTLGLMSSVPGLVLA
ncbi:carbohydrate ABC transporter permease, partial [Streptomyces sp. NPDC002596]